MRHTHTVVRQIRIAKIAREKLGINTLTTQHSDSLDFHTLAVRHIRAALVAAFNAGKEVGKATKS